VSEGGGAVTKDWRKLHEELHDFYCTPNNIQESRSQRMRWAGHVARMEDNRNAYRVSVGQTEEVRSIGRSRCRQKCNIKIYLEEIGWDSAGTRTSAGSFDHGNIFGSITCRVSPF
jgi:hypothetical protein